MHAHGMRMKGRKREILSIIAFCKIFRYVNNEGALFPSISSEQDRFVKETWNELHQRGRSSRYSRHLAKNFLWPRFRAKLQHPHSESLAGSGQGEPTKPFDGSTLILLRAFAL